MTATESSNNLNIATSPSTTDVSDGTHVRRGTLETKAKRITPVQPKHLRPFDTKEIKILLLENVNAQAVDLLKREGYQVEFHSKALPESVLKEKIADAHAIGIRCVLVFIIG